MTDAALTGRIRRLYDDTTRGWLDVWGDHLHHGYYGRRGDERKNRRQAQVDMIEALLAWGEGPRTGAVRRILDAGCGVGGSARHLADALGAEVDGLTLSPVQRDLAVELSGGRDDVRFHVGDATDTGFEDGTFDLVWALESAEHMPDKQAFVEECARVLRPGGRLLAATWCHRPTPPELEEKERKRLQAISAAYGDALTWVPLAEYAAIAERLGLEHVKTDDWSAAVSPFWPAVIRSIFSLKGVRAVVGGGRTMARGALGSMHMRSGLASGLVRFVTFAATKPGGMT
jgi:tocopherol O-methyltransferase